MRTLLNYTLLVIILSIFPAGCQQKPQSLRSRLIYNSDGTDPLGNYIFNQRPLSVSDINSYVDAVANSQVTTFMMCSGSDFMYYRSKYGRILGDDRNGTLNCGNDTVMYSNISKYFHNHLNLEKEGTDVIDASLRRAKEKGMEAFISYRMNDLHFNDTSLHCPLVYTDFWIDHPEYWVNENTGWNSARALDFSFKEVRDHKLNIITEQLEKYDIIDGYDLDFMRFIVYFKMDEGEINAPLMTELVKLVRDKVDEISKERGKKILLSARVPADFDFCLKKGLDIKEWVRLGLLDFVSIGIHWIGNPAMPVAKFREELGNDEIPLYASIDDGGYVPREFYSHGMFRGMASHIHAQGGDGIYLFNYFFGEYMVKYNSQIHLEDGGYVCRIRIPELLNELGSEESLRKRNKIYCLDDGGSAAYGYKPATPLPLQMKQGKDEITKFFIGDNVTKDIPQEVIIFLRTDKPAVFELSVNNVKIEIQKIEYVNLFNRTNNLKNTEKVFAFIVPPSSLKQGYNEVSFHSANSEEFKIKRLEVALKYGDVKTNGYF